MATGTSIRSVSRKRTSKHQHFQVCFCFKRIFKLKVAEPPDEIRTIFDEYSQNGTMSVDDLSNFLVHFQEEEEGYATEKKAQTFFDSVKHLSLFQRKGLHAEAFFRCLLGDLNGPLAEVINICCSMVQCDVNLTTAAGVLVAPYVVCLVKNGV